MHRRVSLITLAAALAVASCRPAPPAPAPSPTPAPPSDEEVPRIVALSPALAIMLRDLGVSEHIVGRHGWDMVLDKSVPVCGDQGGIDYEALIRTEPTHILLEWGSRPLPDRLDSLAGANNWEVANYTLLTLDDLEGAADDLERRFAPDASPAPALAERMAAAWSTREGLYRGRVLLLISADPPAALGPGSFHHQILERIGGQPAFTEGSPYITMDAEDVLRLAPDAIILISPRSPEAPSRETSAEDVRAILGGLGGLDIPAVGDGRLALIDDPLSLTPSSAMIAFADDLARILAGWSQ
jgi:ABC-type Fe3+-hydroxamate transport system substrate-binding protein